MPLKLALPYVAVLPLLVLDRLPPAAAILLLALGAVALAREAWRASRIAGRHAAWVSMALLLVCAGLGAYLAPDLKEAFRRVGAVVAGLLIVARMVATTHGREASWRWLLHLYVGFGALALCVGIGAVLRYAGAVNPNALGGVALLFLLPAVWLATDRHSHMAWRTLGGLATVIAICALIVGRSVTAWVALAWPLAWLLHATVQARWTRWIVRLCAAGTLAGLLAVWWLIAPWGPWSAGGPALLGNALDVRFELWWRAVAMIRDMPLSGVGLGAFDQVVGSYVPLTTMTLADKPHAHNIWLQLALDIGIVGVTAYLMLLWSLGRHARGLAPHERQAAVPLLATVLAVHLFGATDAIALGARVGTLYWAAFGMALSIGAWERQSG